MFTYNSRHACYTLHWLEDGSSVHSFYLFVLPVYKLSEIPCPVRFNIFQLTSFSQGMLRMARHLPDRIVDEVLSSSLSLNLQFS